MLIKHARLLDGTAADIRVEDTITAVEADLSARPGEDILDAAGRTVIPGLHDHHVHLHSAAAALRSVTVGPSDVRDRAGLAGILAEAPVGDDGWIRAVGYHEAVAGPLDRNLLDEIAPPVPVRVQHRSGVLWTLNTAGLERIGRADHPDGRLRSDDHGWSNTLPRNDTGLSQISRHLAGLGVTGVTDATPDLDATDVDALLAAHLYQRVHCLAPGKRILHDTDLDLDGLADWIVDRHDHGTPVAVHCVTAAQLAVTLAALQIAGSRAGDRIEHAAVVPDDSIAALADSGVTVVTQPNFVAERGDQYLDDVPAAEHHELWRLASLIDAGVPVALSTDTPFGDGDPWRAMRAAVHRTTGAGHVLGAAERVAPHRALAMFLGPAERPARPRRIAPGEPGDVVVLAGPPAEVLDALDATMVEATIVAGRPVFER
ncbi:amidohydrolase family protein [Mycolicibacterium flavescens]|uniref:Amidohydrolase n=1 Tax=Mycolicibacterium flavescens TaxID=1776 RepID=A0A1E3RP38_MYCFV|nr:amidohydrolase family protein [Mycolicibacterium flavescens]MCV7281625.1 amidohydrolase family protein [Mycolicibacterium flavescens]ODQ91653.1 amidohydrolase [Mycolicibacterium flavescens]